MTTRPNFSADLEVRQQYLTMVYHKKPGEANWTLINQGKVLTPSAKADEKTYDRLGDKVQTKVAGQIAIDVTLQIYMESDLVEVARALGYIKPGGGWTGSEEIQLTPENVGDFKLVSFAGTTLGSPEVHTEYVNYFTPLNFSVPDDASGDVRTAELSGSARAYYIIPVAG